MSVSRLDHDSRGKIALKAKCQKMFIIPLFKKSGENCQREGYSLADPGWIWFKYSKKKCMGYKNNT